MQRTELMCCSRRAEAKNVPNLLVAIVQTDAVHACGQDHDGWYSDGAYMGGPLFHGNHVGKRGAARRSPQYRNTNFDAVDGADPQETYYNTLLKRFTAFRARLVASPSSTTNKLSSPATEPYTRQPKWSFTFRRTAPISQQIHALPQAQVMLGLERLESLFTTSNLRQPDECRNLGAWAWALLGRCREVSEMSSEEVSTLRQLGKTALWLGRKMRMRQREVRRSGQEDYGKATEEREVDFEVVDGDHASGNEEGEIDNEDGEFDKTLDSGQLQEALRPLGSETANVGETQSSAEQIGAAEAAQSPETNGPHKKSDTGTAESTAMGDDETQELERARERLLAAVAPGAVTHGEANVNGRVEEETSKSEQNMEDGQQTAIEEERERDQIEPNEVEVLDRAFGTLDIIVTIIGELHGQRDLLDAREVWGEYE